MSRTWLVGAAEGLTADLTVSARLSLFTSRAHHGAVRVRLYSASPGRGSVAGRLAPQPDSEAAHGVGNEAGYGADYETDYDVARWLRPADAVDRRAVSVCRGSVIDLGCGPGRLTCALACDRRRRVLGVDLCPEAIDTARRRGAPVLLGDVFARLPREGRWAWAVLADGNIGIGGDPGRLLRRVRELVTADGALLVEAAAEDVDHRGVAHVHDASGRSVTAFRWAVLGVEAIGAAARATGWRVEAVREDGGRHFVALRVHR